jgi:nucleotide-binding universal stress UspA family protein
MRPTSIMHPTDLQAVSEPAFQHALKLGLAAHGRLSLVHVHGYEVEHAPELAAFPQVRETLARWGAMPQGAPQAEVSRQLGLYVSKGELGAIDPEAGLVRLIGEEAPDMIVLGTRGLDGLQRVFEGSFSEKLARDARIPALFVPAGAHGFVDGEDGSVRLQNILVPVTDRPDPAPALAAARQLAALLGEAAVIHRLHVGSPGAMPPDPGASGPVDDIVRPGHVVETIARVADEVDADLIVMATAGHKDFLDALRGDTTEGVLRTARRALLAVPSA